MQRAAAEGQAADHQQADRQRGQPSGSAEPAHQRDSHGQREYSERGDHHGSGRGTAVDLGDSAGRHDGQRPD